MNARIKTRSRADRVAPIVLAAAVALSIAPALSLAQHGHGPGPHHDGGLAIERIFERLDLTDDQRAAVHDAMLEHREQSSGMHEERIALRRALGEAIHAELFDENAVRRAAADVAAVDADLAVSKARMFQEINKVLTSEQRVRMNELIEDWHFMADQFRGSRQGGGPRPEARR